MLYETRFHLFQYKALICLQLNLFINGDKSINEIFVNSKTIVANDIAIAANNLCLSKYMLILANDYVVKNYYGKHHNLLVKGLCCRESFIGIHSFEKY
jgi:hypothetical protein